MTNFYTCHLSRKLFERRCIVVAHSYILWHYNKRDAVFDWRLYSIIGTAFFKIRFPKKTFRPVRVMFHNSRLICEYGFYSCITIFCYFKPTFFIRYIQVSTYVLWYSWFPHISRPKITIGFCTYIIFNIWIICIYLCYLFVVEFYFLVIFNYFPQ